MRMMIAVLMLLASVVHADDWHFQNPYFIAGVGVSDYSSDYRIRDADDSDVAFRVGAGATVTEVGPFLIGAEMSFQDLGQITGDETSVGVDGFAAEVNLSLPLWDRLLLSGHAGGWTYDYTSNYRDGSDSDWLWGGEVLWAFNSTWAAGARWTEYGIDDREVDVLGLTVHTRF